MSPALFKFQKVLRFRYFNNDDVFLEDDWNIYFMVK
ncbi:hypothetical protein D8819_08500 [Streptococcus gordonii]|nr:hypothetical protein D8819_08500 [Streptococcus gordonii]RSJ58229.1 hypothetical protein D8808_01345 [Streptococcus gordonii]RSJ62188.1 hypothetical protein D8807_05165 [Streptococcus gordonii]SQF26936.1 Uncharacterised protein [Streptococcus gordonii]